MNMFLFFVGFSLTKGRDVSVMLLEKQNIWRGVTPPPLPKSHLGFFFSLSKCMTDQEKNKKTTHAN